ncbi:MAG: ADP-forming succinate--CoA ligase subunit beta, partial [Campylobacteraceae bacterium]|nr:ADP-forming succinate--CoA ligase subunit beta [Campylobacteraceae bacterium]
MHIHEYQAKKILNLYDIPVPRGFMVTTPGNALEKAKRLEGESWIVKAQIHAGGRGLGGGVKFAKSLSEVKSLASEIIGMTLRTHQTGPEGKIVKRVYIEESVEIEKEFYLGIVFDRSEEKPLFLASTEGGMAIEEIASSNPEKVVKVSIDPSIGFQAFHGRTLVFGLGLPKEDICHFIKIASSLYKLYEERDAELVEINPLVKTKNGNFVALDAKMSFDDSALYRHPEIEEMRDLDEEDPHEREANEYGLSYVKLEGSVGCMVNGAGLAMGTMDTINHMGGTPANFLDVGGGATPQSVSKGFEIILKDSNVKSIFVNIFGGIVRCDRVANGILEATKRLQVNVPVIVRLDGTNAKEAEQILEKANIPNI